jgi:flavodoxin
MKTAIIYTSIHHENTKKLLDKLCDNFSVDIIPASSDVDLEQYDLIGFASGIYFSSFHKSILEFAKTKLPENKNVFLIYTYGVKRKGYTKEISEIISDKKCEIIGEYSCLGFDTFGPLKLIGGIAKGHPNDNDIKKCMEFFSKIKG